MKLPKRPETHVTETESWRILQSLAPKEWIVREVSERDYGIDCYIELASQTGFVTGNLISAQLKGVNGIEWNRNGETQSARSPSIRTSTAAYWLSLPVPVFLFVADLGARDIYYVSVEDSIRAQYDKLSGQDSLSFTLLSELSLKSKKGMALLPWFYSRERVHDQFSFHIMNLVSHIDSFSAFIGEHQGRDQFMEVEADDHLQFRALYESCRMASLYLERDWKVDSLDDLYAKDRGRWRDECVWLHEETLDYALHKIEKVFPALVRKAIKMVTETQSSYWRDKDPVFFDLCGNGDLTWRLDQLENKNG